MSKKEDNRVFARNGARELTTPEYDFVGAAYNTLVCTFAFATATHTGAGDGDGCGDVDTDTSHA
jgi:hypothetical protein